MVMLSPGCLHSVTQAASTGDKKINIKILPFWFTLAKQEISLVMGWKKAT